MNLYQQTLHTDAVARLGLALLWTPVVLGVDAVDDCSQMIHRIRINSINSGRSVQLLIVDTWFRQVAGELRDERRRHWQQLLQELVQQHNLMVQVKQLQWELGLMLIKASTMGHLSCLQFINHHFVKQLFTQSQTTQLQSFYQQHLQPLVLFFNCHTSKYRLQRDALRFGHMQLINHYLHMQIITTNNNISLDYLIQLHLTNCCVTSNNVSMIDQLIWCCLLNGKSLTKTYHVFASSLSLAATSEEIVDSRTITEEWVNMAFDTMYQFVLENQNNKKQTIDRWMQYLLANETATDNQLIKYFHKECSMNALFHINMIVKLRGLINLHNEHNHMNQIQKQQRMQNYVKASRAHDDTHNDANIFIPKDKFSRVHALPAFVPFTIDKFIQTHKQNEPFAILYNYATFMSNDYDIGAHSLLTQCCILGRSKIFARIAAECFGNIPNCDYIMALFTRLYKNRADLPATHTAEDINQYCQMVPQMLQQRQQRLQWLRQGHYRQINKLDREKEFAQQSLLLSKLDNTHQSGFRCKTVTEIFMQFAMNKLTLNEMSNRISRVISRWDKYNVVTHSDGLHLIMYLNTITCENQSIDWDLISFILNGTFIELLFDCKYWHFWHLIMRDTNKNHKVILSFIKYIMSLVTHAVIKCCRIRASSSEETSEAADSEEKTSIPPPFKKRKIRDARMSTIPASPTTCSSLYFDHYIVQQLGQRSLNASNNMYGSGTPMPTQYQHIVEQSTTDSRPTTNPLSSCLLLHRPSVHTPSTKWDVKDVVQICGRDYIVMKTNVKDPFWLISESQEYNTILHNKYSTYTNVFSCSSSCICNQMAFISHTATKCVLLVLGDTQQIIQVNDDYQQKDPLWVFVTNIECLQLVRERYKKGAVGRAVKHELKQMVMHCINANSTPNFVAMKMKGYLWGKRINPTLETHFERIYQKTMAVAELANNQEISNECRREYLSALEKLTDERLATNFSLYSNDNDNPNNTSNQDLIDAVQEHIKPRFYKLQECPIGALFTHDELFTTLIAFPGVEPDYTDIDVTSVKSTLEDTYQSVELAQTPTHITIIKYDNCKSKGTIKNQYHVINCHLRELDNEMCGTTANDDISLAEPVWPANKSCFLTFDKSTLSLGHFLYNFLDDPCNAHVCCYLSISKGNKWTVSKGQVKKCDLVVVMDFTVTCNNINNRKTNVKMCKYFLCNLRKFVASEWSYKAVLTAFKNAIAKTIDTVIDTLYDKFHEDINRVETQYHKFSV